jgi:hypothetical protein
MRALSDHVIDSRMRQTREGFAFDAFVIATLHVLQFGSANPVVKHDAICGAESHRTRA